MSNKPQWLTEAILLFEEDECLRNDDTAPKVADQWVKHFGVPRPHKDIPVDTYDGGDYLACLYKDERIYFFHYAGAGIMVTKAYHKHMEGQT